MPFVYRFLLPLLWTSALLAQAAYFAPRAALTNTRYAPMSGTPALASDGTQTYVFISTAHDIRMARTSDLVARPVLQATDGDAVWTGSRFLVAGTSGGAIVGRFVNANGDAAGEPFTMVARGTRPRLAIDGERLLLVYEDAGAQSLALHRDGTLAGLPQAVASSAMAFDVAAHRGEFVVAAATGEGVKVISLGGSAAVTRVTDVVASDVTIASNGESVVVAWTREETVQAAVVVNGVAEAPFGVAGGAAHSSLLWNGTAYEAALAGVEGLRVAQVNPSARTARPAALSLLSAPDQELVAAASVSAATLVVWNEGGDAYVGVRLANGVWRERRLAAGERAVAAASDGSGFVVVTANDAGWTAAWLDANGVLLQQSQRVSAFAARAIAANPLTAAAIGRDASGNVAAARLSRDGTVSDAVTLRASADDPAIASDGTNFIATWETAEKTIESVRLDALLQRLDAADLLVFGEGEDPAVAFNGTHYVFAARVGEFVRARRVTPAGEKIFEIVQTGRTGGEPPRAIALTRLDGMVGLAWHDGRSQLALFEFGGEMPWTVRAATGFESRSDAAPRLAALPDGGVAFLHSEVRGDAPHYGSARVAVSVAHPAAPIAPEAPRASVTQEAGRLRVAWNAPSHPVRGYRIESRVDDGPWLEAEVPTDGDTRSATLDARKPGLHTVRIRTWSDSGVSAYSEPVSVQVTPAGRRRAVR